MVQKFKDVQTVHAAVQQSIHAFKCRLTDVQPIIYCVLEGAHLNLRRDSTCRNLKRSQHRIKLGIEFEFLLQVLCNSVSYILHIVLYGSFHVFSTFIICTSRTRSFLIWVSLYRCGRSDVRSPRIREGLLWAAELNMTKATCRTLRSGSWSVFRKSPNSRISN